MDRARLSRGMVGRIPVIDVMPLVDHGRLPAKAAVGEPFPVTATVFREGHDKLGADVVLVGPDKRPRPPVRLVKLDAPVDRHRAWVTPDAPGPWTFEVRAWSDPVATWQHDAGIKIPAGIDVDLMFLEGALLLERVRRQLPRGTAAEKSVVDAALKAAKDAKRPVEARLAQLQSAELLAVLDAHPLRDLLSTYGPFPVFVDRELALYGSWYEFFPRSEGATVDPDTGKVVTGTLRTAAERLPAVRAMGFDIIYLPPIHPIGEVNRKGPNNTLTPGPDDTGSPWAIGSKDGGHDAVHPDLGTIDDFDALRRPRRRPRARGRARPRAPGGARPPLGHQSPGVVHHPRRRHHRLRGEPAEEVPGHLPDQLRQRPHRHLPRGAAGGAALDEARRPRVPGRQPAHQAGGVLAVAARRGAAHRPRRDLPVRGVHEAADDAQPRLGRVPPDATPTSPGAPRAGRSRSTCAR